MLDLITKNKLPYHIVLIPHTVGIGRYRLGFVYNRSQESDRLETGADRLGTISARGWDVVWPPRASSWAAQGKAPGVHGVLARRWEAGGAGWWVRDSFVVRFCDCVASRIHRPAAFCVLFNPLVFNSCTD